MTTAEKTLKWWNDYKKMNGTYPLILEIESQLQMAVDEEKLVKNCSIPDVGQSFAEIKSIAFGEGTSSERMEEIKKILSQC